MKEEDYQNKSECRKIFFRLKQVLITAMLGCRRPFFAVPSHIADHIRVSYL